ncbi:MAG: hypothetical protein LBT16_14640 [Treponema sp.]|jgi:hypothetical protein|nr:hypothetical protein [Treponema sp.]
MKYYIDPILAECQQRKAELLEEHGGSEGLSKYLDEWRPYWEAQGWHFETPEEFETRIARHRQ